MARCARLGIFWICATAWVMAAPAQRSAGKEMHMNTAADLKKTLDSSRDQRELEQAAIALASSRDEGDLNMVGSYLRDGAFLARLDSVRDPKVKTLRFRSVVDALGRNPAPATGKVLQSLLGSASVKAMVDRIDVILGAAALGKPMTEERVATFRMVDREIYLPSNLSLLVANGEKPALEEARREIVQKPPEMPDHPIVNIMHRSFLTHRTDAALVRMAQELASDPISQPLRTALFESFFDYQPNRWFGPVLPSPKPAPYETASKEALQELLRLAEKAGAANLPGELRQKVESAAAQIRQILRTHP